MIRRADVHEIIANFVDAEFRADWEAAAAVHGDYVTPALLDRTDRQRQADAVVTLCGKHNRFKSRHDYRPRRDQRGHWHLYDPQGNIVA